MEALESFDLTSTRSLRFENFQLHEYQVARQSRQSGFMICFTPIQLFARTKESGVGGGGWLGAGTAQSRGGLADRRPILTTGAGVGKALAPSCRDTLSLSSGHKRGLVLARQCLFHMLLTAPAPLPREITLSSQKTNLFLFHQNVLTDLVDLSGKVVCG